MLPGSHFAISHFLSLVPSRPRRFRMWRHLSSLSGKFAEDVSSRYRTRFQASSGNSDNANWPGYEAGIFMSDSVSCRFQGIRNFLKISGRCGTITWWPNDMQCLKERFSAIIVTMMIIMIVRLWQRLCHRACVVWFYEILIQRLFMAINTKILLYLCRSRWPLISWFYVFNTFK